MNKKVYRRLADALNERRQHLPSVPCDEFYALAEELFNPEQAEIACSMPLEPVTAEELAVRMSGSDVSDLREKLEEMAVRGLILVREKDNKKYYELLCLMPGSIELQFLAGQADERAKRLYLLARKYMKAVTKERTLTPLPGSTTTSGSRRVIPMKKLFIDHMTILPYGEVMKLIDTREHVAAGTCMCRHGGELLNYPCNKPKDNICMAFGESARSLAERGFIHLVSKNEARQILDEAEKAGLVHQYTNHKDSGVDFLCNCCSCHCRGLRGVINSPSPSQSVKAEWVNMIEDTFCTGCGICIDRCCTNALKIQGGIAVCDLNRCIGCGLCRYECPTDAIKLIRRETTKVTG